MVSLIKAVAFDAVGTLIYAMPSVSSAYCSILREVCGMDVDPGRVRSVLGFRLSARTDEANLRTSEDRERQFWFDLIAELVDDHSLREPAFDALFAHFAISENWRCFDDVEPVLTSLKSRGVRLLLASNFDHRLHAVMQGLGELSSIDHVIVSSEVGWRKPARAFFEQVCEVADCKPQEVLFVGDDLTADVDGARSAGLIPIWLDRSPSPNTARALDVPAIRCQSLQELLNTRWFHVDPS